MRNSRTLILFAVLALVLGYVNYNAWTKERTIANGQPMLLELIPVDPRSLMQGDFMVLDYALTNSLREPLGERAESRTVIVQLDENNVATFSRNDDGGKLRAEEHRLKLFGRPYGELTIGTNSYFFEEGSGNRFATAQYGELRVSADGKPILVNLRDADFNQLDLVD